jgi:hypothetical protein
MFGLNAKQLFMLVLLVFALFAGSEIIPAYFHAYQFNDAIREEVRFAVSTRKTPERIRTDIVEHAKEFDINLNEKQIHLTRRGPAFTVDFDYVVPINLRIYQHDLMFHVSEDGELFDQ